MAVYSVVYVVEAERRKPRFTGHPIRRVWFDHVIQTSRITGLIVSFDQLINELTQVSSVFILIISVNFFFFANAPANN